MYIWFDQLQVALSAGTTFPTWLKDPLFTNMVHIAIENCSNCSLLPSLGQLKSLKKLYIQGMSGVRYVGREFYGPLSQKPFPSLETLSFYNMQEWEDWFAFGVEDEVQPFGHVKNLMIENCPNLSEKLPTNLPSLENLNIIKCEKLVVKLDGHVYPSLSSVYVNGVELPFTLPKINYVKNTHESSSISSPITKNITIPNSLFNINVSFQNLTSVEIVGVPKLVHIPKWLPLTSLKKLKIDSCKELETLLDNSNIGVMQLEHQFPVLEEVTINSCRELVSLFSEEMDVESGSRRESKAVQSFMERLKTLCIMECDKLEKLPLGLYMLTCLDVLTIHACPNLVSFPETGFPPTLVELNLRDCKALESPLPHRNNLEFIYVESCPSLTRLVSSSSSNNNNSIRTGGLPLSLKSVSIFSCEKLEALFVGEENRIHCPSLKDFTIQFCRRFKYLPDTRSDDSLGKLKELTLSDCGDLQYLPDGWVHAITNLSHSELGRETILSPYILKETSFLINLNSLCLNNITVCVHPSEWGLHGMSSLRQLSVYGPIRVAREEVKVCVFPLDGMLLPTSLTKLIIGDFPDLEMLHSKGFDCLSSLQELELYDCPRLAYLPEGGLPDTFLRLFMMECPLLKKKCEKGKGKYWSIISRIPHVDIKQY